MVDFIVVFSVRAYFITNTVEDITKQETSDTIIADKEL